MRNDAFRWHSALEGILKLSFEGVKISDQAVAPVVVFTFICIRIWHCSGDYGTNTKKYNTVNKKLKLSTFMIQYNGRD